jgi:hypothetical protein
LYSGVRGREAAPAGCTEVFGNFVDRSGPGILTSAAPGKLFVVQAVESM